MGIAPPSNAIDWLFVGLIDLLLIDIYLRVLKCFEVFCENYPLNPLELSPYRCSSCCKYTTIEYRLSSILVIIFSILFRNGCGAGGGMVLVVENVTKSQNHKITHSQGVGVCDKCDKCDEG